MHLIVEISDKPGSSNPLEAAIDKFEVSEGPLAIHLFDAPSQALLIAPNPAGEYTRLLIPGNGNGQPVPVDVLDANGRLVWQGAGQEGSLVTIPTAEWAPGIYIARVKNHSGTPLYGKIVR